MHQVLCASRLLGWWDYARWFTFMKIRPGWIHVSKTPRHSSRALLILRSLGLMRALAYFASGPIAQTRYQITRIHVPSSANSVALGFLDKRELISSTFDALNY